MNQAQTKLDQLCVNAIRVLAIDGVQKANSGHPGLPLGAAPMAYVLWQNFLRHNPSQPQWSNRDRFILSAGHGSMLLYSLMHLTGYDLPLNELKRFRQWDSRTPGHPEHFITRGVDATTGPLGQGAGSAVGMAMAERFLANHFNRPGHSIVDHRTFALVSDGDLMEGVSAEASSLAGHLKLGKLTYLYDANEICLDGPTSLCFTEDVGKRYEAYGWQVLHVKDGNHDLEGIKQALLSAQQEVSKPTLIIVRTTIGFGSPNKQGKSASHGSPLGEDEVKLVKKAFGFAPEAHFTVPQEAQAHLRTALKRGAELQATWDAAFAAYQKAHPQLAAAWQQAQQGSLPAGWDKAIPSFTAGEKLATREAGGKVLNGVAQAIPTFIGGDADLSISTLTGIKSSGSFDGQNAEGRNLRFGVREHAMGAIANGMAFHQGVYPFVSTFFVFSDYMRPAVRMAALCRLPVTYVWTHDSIGLGEDGPTHQPIEHLMSLRAMPNILVMRPCDATETAECWRFAMGHRSGPVAMVLSRQKLLTLDREALGAEGGKADVGRGAYIVAEAKGGQPQGIIVATGSEVHTALEAQQILAAEQIRVRVISMPCWELFAAQDEAYQKHLFPDAIDVRLSIEAGTPFGWERWVGPRGAILGISSFGHSAPAETIYEKLGITGKNAASLIKRQLR